MKIIKTEKKFYQSWQDFIENIVRSATKITVSFNYNWCGFDSGIFSLEKMSMSQFEVTTMEMENEKLVSVSLLLI